MLVVPLKFMCSTQCETPVRPGLLVLRADLVPAPHRRQRRRVLFLDEHLQAVVEPVGTDGREDGRADTAISIIIQPDRGFWRTP